LTLPAVITNCALQAEGRFDRLLYMRMVNQFSFIAFIIYFAVTGQLTLLKVMYSYLTSQLITTIYLLARGWSYVSALKNRTKKTINELYHYGKYTVAGNISANLLRGSDIFIIEFMFPGKPGLELIGVYNFGLRLMEVVEIPLRSFVATAMPAISAAYNQGKKGYVIFLMKKYAGFITFALIPVCVGSVLLADVAVFILGGKKYMGTEAANVLRLFMTFALLFPTDRFFAVTLDAIHKPNINVLKILAMLAVNIITDFAGIRIFGNIYGVALATIFPTLVGIGIGYWALNKYQPFSILNIYKVGWDEVKALIYKVLKKPLPQPASEEAV
jgi:O-antigen/teichoic acid export membrane protein